MNRLIFKTKLLWTFSMVLGLLMLPSFAQATGILATGGEVMVTFGGSDAGYTSTLYLGNTKIMSSKATTGTTFNLGNIAAGTYLDFRIEVQNTGHTFYMGTGGANIDGVTHAMVDDLGNSTQVGWEDLLGGGDKDYNDLVFNFSNTMAGEAGGEAFDVVTGEGEYPGEGETLTNPEPSTMILFGSGLLGLGAWRLRKKKV